MRRQKGGKSKGGNCKNNRSGARYSRYANSTHFHRNNSKGKGKVFDDKDNDLELDIIRFEIRSVYKGDKYKDTAITEIYFDGL